MTTKKQKETRTAERGIYLYPILVGLTFEQREQIKRTAKAAGVTVGEWAREKLIRAAERGAKSS